MRGGLLGRFGRYGAVGRWAAVAFGTAVLVALPPTLRLLPAADSDISATALLAKIEASANAGYSGYAEAVGGLRLPLSSQFSALVDLFGERSKLRVWWRGGEDWRVDTITPTGEHDVHRDRFGTWTWDYEDNRAVRSDEPEVRLPRPSDMDPAQLGRRLLSEVTAAEITRLPARRIAGRDAPGLRLTPADKQTTINRVDVWADPETGAPLRVDVGGVGLALPVVSTAYLDFNSDRPAQSLTRYDPPTGLGIKVDGGNDDLAARIDSFISVEPPRQLAGYPVRKRLDGLGAIGTYGTGVTVLTAVPLPGRIAGPLGETLAKTPGVQDTQGAPTQGSITYTDGSTGGNLIVLQPGPRTLLITVGPVSLLEVFVDGDQGPAWLLTGTVTADVLKKAASQLIGTPILFRRR
jgi:hypothetical protein